MTKGEFIRNSFRTANLEGADLAGANLSRAVFHGAKLAGASFRGAFVHWTRIEDTDLSSVRDLTQAQVDSACGDPTTKLPAGLAAPESWPCPPD
jgi:uncharacterized protein YjbI with pentapeptide repeats